jgi:hypothetical protein
MKQLRYNPTIIVGGNSRCNKNDNCFLVSSYGRKQRIPVSVKRRNHHNSDYYNLAGDDNFTGSKASGSRIKREGRESPEDVIVSD